MNNTALLQHILDEAFATQDFGSLASHLAEDVVFEVTPPEGMPTTPERRGKQEVLDYFTALGDIVTFWQVRCFGEGERVVVVGAESFTIPPHDVTLGGEFALLLHVCDGLITRFLIVEDLSESRGAISEELSVISYPLSGKHTFGGTARIPDSR